MKNAVDEELLPINAEREEGDIIPPGNDNRGKGDIIPRKQYKPVKQGEKILLND